LKWPPRKDPPIKKVDEAWIKVSPDDSAPKEMREGNKDQQPIYSVNKAFRGAEGKYPPVKKDALTLVILSKEIKLHCIGSFNFPVSNNKAKYEIVITSLTLVLVLGGVRVEVKTYAILVAKQINGEFEPMRELKKKYLNKLSRSRDELYKRSSCLQFLSYVGLKKTAYVMHGLHEGICGNRSGSQSLIKKP
jgi:ribonuclease HI